MHKRFQRSKKEKCLTNCLSGIRNAWHFQHAVSFVIKLVCGSFCSALLTP
ncbi:TPA: DUF3265 domain-containing protein [Vibrio vulnificus]|nr:DUF3265 domain-containing protein [Vibrio vulnificus]